METKPKTKLPFILLIPFAIIAICCMLFFCSAAFAGIIEGIAGTHTPSPTSQIINTPILQSTATFPPTQTPPPPTANSQLPTEINPTSTTFISVIQTNNAVSLTEYIYSTNTPFILATQPANQNAVCSCAGDTLNCSDFASHSSAQACFNYCVSQGRGDIHRLDKDGNNLACESLP